MNIVLPPSFTQGFAVVTARGSILGHTYRQTRDEAIAALLGDPGLVSSVWHDLEADGYTVLAVYARIFAPVYFPTKPDTEGAAP